MSLAARRFLWAGLLALAALPGTAVPQTERLATLKGRVSADTTLRPIADAEVYLPDLTKSVRTDSWGAFRISDIPAGRHRVRARHVGYASFDAWVTLGEGQAVELGIVLPRVAVLDTVSVVSEANLPLSFLDHRAVGLGRFLVRADLEKLTASHLSRALVQVQGVSLLSGRSGQAWILSKRAAAPIRSLSGGGSQPGDEVWSPGASERSDGMVPGCYARVYLDRQLLNPTSPAEPVDINQFPPEMIEAVEWFAGPSQTPMEYSKLNSRCGVLVLHRRR